MPVALFNGAYGSDATANILIERNGRRDTLPSINPIDRRSLQLVCIDYRLQKAPPKKHYAKWISRFGRAHICSHLGP